MLLVPWPRLAHVGGDLRGERIERIEVRLVAQLAAELDADQLSVHVAVEVEQVHFEQGPAVALHRGSRPEARHAGQRLGPEAVDPDDEDARQGGAGEGDLQVQRRKAEVTPELAPVHDVARDAVAASQQLAGACEVARGEGGAHGRAGYALAVGEHAAELLELEAPGRRRRLQRVDVARALRAEAEVVAHQQEAGPQPLDDDLVDERLRREPRERLVEAGDADPVDAAGRQRIELVPLGEDARGGLAAMARREELARMGLDGEHAAREAAAPGLLDQPPEHRLVPAMDAIVVADRQRANGALVGGRQAAEDIHGRGGAASGKTLNYKVFAAGLARRPVLESRDEKNRRADIGPWLQHDGAREALPRGALAGPHRRG